MQCPHCQPSLSGTPLTTLREQYGVSNEFYQEYLYSPRLWSLIVFPDEHEAPPVEGVGFAMPLTGHFHLVQHGLAQ